MNVVVTGGSGYLGNRLVRAMLALGWNVTVLVRAGASRTSLAPIQDLIKIVEVSDVSRAFESLDDLDIVVHTATCYGRNHETASTIIASNMLFPLQVLECAVEHGATLFCNTDSALSEYVNLYGLSKKQFLEWLRTPSCNGKTRVANLVLDQFYGPGESEDKFITWIVRQCLNNGEIQLTVGTQKRRFLFIDDLVDGYVKAIEAAWKSKDPLLQFHLASKSEYPIREICEKVHKLTNSTARLNFGAIPMRNHEMREEKIDINSMLVLGWREQVSLDDGIALVVEHERGLLH